MLQQALVGVWTLKTFVIVDASGAEHWDKDGLLIMTADGYISGAINYTGHVAADRTKRFSPILIRDYFFAGTYTVTDSQTVEIFHLQHCMPQRINWKESRRMTVDGNVLTETISRDGPPDLILTWERAVPAAIT